MVKKPFNVEQRKYMAYGIRMVAVAQFVAYGYPALEGDAMLYLVASSVAYMLGEWLGVKVLEMEGNQE